MFRADKLVEFLRIYDPVLVGWGIDRWFLPAMGPDLRGHVAVVDSIPCINPGDEWRGGVREIDTYQTRETRERAWGEIKESRGLVEWRPVKFESIPKSWPSRMVDVAGGPGQSGRSMAATGVPLSAILKPLSLS